MFTFFKDRRKIRKLVYLGLTILPATLTGGICETINTTSSKTNTLNTLNTLSNNLQSQVYTQFNHVSSNLKLLANSTSFQTLNNIEITKQMDLLRYYNKDSYTDLGVFDKQLNLIYGVALPTSVKLNSAPYIQQALGGNSSYDYYILDDGPQLCLAYPIFESTNSASVVGVLLCTVNLKYLSEILLDVRLFGDSMEAYLVDSNGILISESKYIPKAVNQVRVDINRIKTCINYDQGTPFKNYRGLDALGVYFELSELNWTILVTNETDGSNGMSMNSIGWLSALFSTGIITGVELLNKVRKNSSIVLDALSDEAIDTLLDSKSTFEDNSPCKTKDTP